MLETKLQPKGWKETTLGEVAEKIIDYRGKTPKKLGGDWSSNGKYRALSAKSVKTGGLVNLDQINRVDENMYKKWMKDEIVFNDILLTSEAPMGEVLIWKSNEKIVLSQRLFAIRAKKEISPDYLYYFFISKVFQAELLARASGTTVVGIRQTELAKTKINLPALGEQIEIAAVLSSLDNKIALLQKQNETLEQIARAIFNEWFVEFNFPNDKGQPYKASGGKMIDSELGEIPEGWRVFLVNDFIDIQKGLSYKGSGLSDVGIPLINLGNFNSGNGFNPEKIKHYTGEFKERHKVKKGEIVIANTDITQDKVVLGSPALVPLDGDVLFTHHVFKVIQINEISKFFLYLLFQTPEYRERVYGFATGTTVLALPRDAILSMSFVFPQKSIMAVFDNVVSKLYMKMDINNVHLKQLSGIRDQLLPKLMSGEVRVK